MDLLLFPSFPLTGHAAQRHHLVIVVMGSNRYSPDDLVRAVALGRGRQKDWVILEQTDDAQKVVNVCLQFQ